MVPECRRIVGRSFFFQMNIDQVVVVTCVDGVALLTTVGGPTRMTRPSGRCHCTPSFRTIV